MGESTLRGVNLNIFMTYIKIIHHWNVLHLILGTFTFGAWVLYFDFQKVKGYLILFISKIKILSSRNNGYIHGIHNIIELMFYFKLH